MIKPSLKSLGASMKATVEPKPEAAPQEAPKNYRTAETRLDTRQLSGHFPADDVKAFKRMALENDLDVQELLAEALNMAFERYGQPNRLQIVSGRRKR